VVVFDPPEVSVLSGHALALHQVKKKSKITKDDTNYNATLSGVHVCVERDIT
jgi:hypothetical protein